MSNTINLKGRIHRVGELFERGSFRKREVIIDTGHDWDRFYKIEFKNDEVENAPSLNSDVEIECFINGVKEPYMKDGKELFFLSLTAKSVNVIGKSSPEVDSVVSDESPF